MWHVLQRAWDFKVAACALNAAGGEHSNVLQRAAPTAALQLCNKAACHRHATSAHAYLIWGHTLPFPSCDPNICKPDKTSDLT